MKSPYSLILALSFGWGLSAFGQYGYTPPVPPNPPTMPAPPQDPYATYPATTGAVPPAGTGMDVGYSASTYGTPTYGGYEPQPMAGSSAMAMGPSFNILSYGYIEAFYQYTDFKHSSLDAANGLGIALSAKLFDPLFVKGGFNWATSNGGSGEAGGFDFTSTTLGLGGYIPVTARFHLLCDVGGAYYQMDADKDFLSFSEGAIYVHPGVRVAATESLELEGGLLFSTSNDYDSIIFDVGAYWKMFTMLDLKLGADFGDESTAWKAGLRFRW